MQPKEFESKIVTEKRTYFISNSGMGIIKELGNGKVVIRRKTSNKAF